MRSFWLKHCSNFFNSNKQNFLQLAGSFKLDRLCFIIEELKPVHVLSLELHLLLRCPITMPKYCDDWTQLPTLFADWCRMRAIRLWYVTFLRKIVRKECFLPDVKFAIYDRKNLCGAIFIILVRSLDERKTIYVTHVSFGASSKHVETTDVLFESSANTPGVLLLLMSKIDGVANFFLSYRISLHFSIYWWRFARFSMSIEFANCIHFDVKAIGWQELLVKVRSLCS